MTLQTIDNHLFIMECTLIAIAFLVMANLFKK